MIWHASILDDLRAFPALMGNFPIKNAVSIYEAKQIILDYNIKNKESLK